MVEKKKADRVIDPKLLLINILKQWKKVLIVSLIMAIGFAGFTYTSGKGKTLSKEEYEAQLATYETNKENQEKKIEQVQESIKTVQQYSKDSVLCNIDPYHEYQANLTVSISAAVFGNGATTRAYAAAVTNSVDYDAIAKKLNMTRQCVKELVTVTPDYMSYTVQVVVIGMDENVPSVIMNEIVNSIKNQKNRMTDKYGSHVVALSDVSICETADMALILQLGTSTHVYNQKMENVKLRLNSLNNNLATLQSELSAIKKPKRNSGVSKKDALIAGIPAFFVGILLMALYYVVKSFFVNKVNSEDDLSLLYGIESLGVIPVNTEKKNAIDKMFIRMGDSASGIAKDVAVEMSVMNINGAAKDCKSVLLAGVAGKDAMNAVAEEIMHVKSDVEIVYSCDINASVEELEKMKNVDAVVVVVERDVTKTKDLHNTVKTIRTWQKPVLGSIVL